MKTAMIILNYNSAELTLKLLYNIKDYESINKIIVVDNNSTIKNGIKLLNEVKSQKIHVIQTPENKGYSYGNNYGIKYIESLGEKFDYIIISNPDVEFKEEAIKKCLQELNKNSKAAIVAPRLVDKNGNPIRRSSWKIRTPGLDMVNSTRFTQGLFYWKFKSGEYSNTDFEKEKLQVEAVSGAFFVIKYDIFKKCGFFDENTFLFYEEDILASKIRDLGYNEYSLNSVNVIHYESQTIGKAMNYFNKMKILQKSKMYYQKKYNKINGFQNFIFEILNFWKKVELLVEIPIRLLKEKLP